MIKNMFFHISDQELMPVGVMFDNINNISNYDDDSIESILIQDLLDYYTDGSEKEILEKLIKKLKVGGIIEIQGVDIKKLGIGIAFNDINEKFTKNILYPYKKSIHSINEIEELLMSLDLSIENKKYVNAIEYFFIAKK